MLHCAVGTLVSCLAIFIFSECCGTYVINIAKNYWAYPNFVPQLDSAWGSLLMLSRGHLNLYPLGRKVDFLFWGKSESKTSCGNSLFVKHHILCRRSPLPLDQRWFNFVQKCLWCRHCISCELVLCHVQVSCLAIYINMSMV